MGRDMLAMPAMPRGEVGDLGGEVAWFWSLLVAMVLLLL